MTKEEFRLLQQQHRESGKSLKKFLIDVGICYSNYNYWNKKFNTEKTPPLAPITFTASSAKSSLISPPVDVPSGVTLLFPNGLKAHFGAGTETLLKELLKQSLSAHVLS